MPKRMLIDASHPEETRVVILDGQKVEEFDFEAASKRPLKGNIYLAKVTRVEPSLQAAFVEYGGNRQGFLAFSEIHPDYYQIPVADRMALIAEQEAEARESADDDFEAVATAEPGSEPAAPGEETHDHDEAFDEHTQEDESGEHGDEPAHDADGERHDTGGNVENDEEIVPAETSEAEDHEASVHSPETHETEQPSQPLQIQRPPQRWVRKRHYKIQEVVKRRQVMLVQVVKEERGNKGAALTTYLSLAGRYCVLMPNTPRGGGISRKITNANDRKRLKSAAAALELPKGMGLIIRTAGENRTKLEIKRDYEYLLRMWDTIRELTLKSNAPACVYEEGDLIKRAIRDLYNKDVSEIVVEGEDGYRNAKDFMRMLMPSHAKNVKPYKEAVPLFHRHHIEAQLDAMFSPTVTLKSGGYIVINQAEALVAIDVNSGRATREHNIEDTATKTNLEAADEIARQLRLRDLAGLIVIDFIDMEDARNDRAVEKRLLNAIKTDRARVQVGKISQFGLLEMSRQRLRAGVVAGSTVPCPHCAGQGIVRSVESTALRVLRGLEEEGQHQRAAAVKVRVPVDVAVYTLNQKRRELARIESDYAMAIAFEPDVAVTPGNFEIDRVQQREAQERAKPVPAAEPVAAADEETTIAHGEEHADEETVAAQSASSQEGEQQQGRRRRRRRRRGRGRDRDQLPVIQEPIPASGETEFDAELAAEAVAQESDANGIAAAQAGEEGAGKRKRRRRRRGRRGRRDEQNAGAAEAGGNNGANDDLSEQAEDETAESGDTAPVLPPAAPLNAPSAPVWSLAAEEAQPLGKSMAHDTTAARNAIEERPPETARESLRSERPAEEPAGPPRKGWWQRTFRSSD